ncbi:hypothetical protein AB6A40_003643 [Gnathostoma spinigerum]|uniref:C2H2-type domain-containing protein n=1 Tax=Gnathostoma spinigerum TaxID=75299 RepID=A0ABD6EA56_9BILA
MPDVLSGSSAENGVNINKNAARQDAVPNVWFRDTCMVCQTVHKSDAEKSTHVACKTHVKRACVYQFFSKEVGRCTAVKVYSVLVKRYENARVSMAGLECIHELIVPFAQTPWWACSICYMAGCSLDSADAHLRSAEHQLTYLDEFHPNRVINRSSSRVDLLQQLFTVCCEVVEEQEGLQSPEVLQLNGVTKESASNILGLDETDEVKGFTRGDSFCGHYSIHCKACGEIIVTSSESEERCWNVHTARDYHQKMHAINCFVEQLENIPIENPFKNIVTTNIWQKCSDGTVLGPLTALQNLIYFGSYPYCILCHCVINPKQVVEHFRCENHITSVLATTNPSKVYSAQQKTDGRRRAIMQEMLETLSKQRPGGPPRKINTLSVPNHILLFSNSDIRNKPSIIPQILNLSVDVSRRFYYCPICWKLIPLQSEESDVAVEWCEHCVRSRRHGQNAVRREKFYFDEANFVDVVSTLKFGESENAEPVWMEASCDGVQVEIQKQTLVGLDWIVDDLSSNEVVCTVCAAIYKRSDINSIEVHIRSLDHLMQVLYNTDREMAALVKSQKTADIECSLLMDYLQRSLPSVGQVRVYSPKLAKQISKWGNIKLRTIELAIIPAASRPVYKALLDIVDHIADDRVENMEIPIKDALHFCSVRIHSLNDDSALLWCMQCRKAFTAFHSTVIDDTWQKHFSSESHFIRARSFMENRFEEDGFCHDSPSIKIPQLDQAALEKNVTWRWNEELHTLCAESVPCDQSAFEKHIRQRNHVTNFLHIHCIDAVRELELLLNDTSNDSRRALRRFLAQVLKNERNKSSEMRVYDPERMHRLKDNQVTVKQELKEQEEFQSASSKEDETGKQLCHQESSFVKRLSDAEVEESDQTKDAICLKSPCKKPRKEADQEERVIRSQILKNEKNEGECIASAGNVQKSSKTVNEQENTTFAPGNGQAEETDGASNSVAPPDTISLPTDVTMARGTPTDNSPSLNETSVPQQSSDKVSNHPISKAKRLKTSSELSTPGRDRGRSASSHRGSTRASSKMTINDVKTRDELVEFSGWHLDCSCFLLFWPKSC